MSALKPLHFIVTRPNHQQQNLIDGLSNLSINQDAIQISHFPLIQITDYNENRITLKPRYDGVIFISSNAVNYCKGLLTPEQWENLLRNPLYAVGEQTATHVSDQRELLEIKSSKPVIYPTQMDSEGLLSVLPLKAIAQQSWLIVKGLGGRKKLKQVLCKSGAQIEELDVYQRKLPDLSIQKNIFSVAKTNPIWLITSQQALVNLWRILEKRTQNCRIIVSSDRIAAKAVKLGFSLVARSNGATDSQLILTVQNLIQNPAQD